MLKLFQYNWQVREDWFNWCESVPEEELFKKRVGGIGSIMQTLLHIVEVEYGWICLDLLGKPEPEEFSVEEIANLPLPKVRDLSRQYHKEVEPFVSSWTEEMENRTFTETGPNGETVRFQYGEIMRHVLAHEIHHIGQLSIWSREIGRKPVTANLIGRGLYD
ncbi:MAG TPA: DinB family protein [Bacillales bacterium]|nr:DinB family protein [Bacillales bacterium]